MPRSARIKTFGTNRQGKQPSARASRRSLREAAREYLARQTQRQRGRLLPARVIHPKRGRRRLLRASNVWQKWEIALLGRVTDCEVTRQTGRSMAAVLHKRQTMRIACLPELRKWTPEEVALLGTVPDESLAKRLGRTVMAVGIARRKRAIPKPNRKRRLWTEAANDIVRSFPAREAARRLKAPLTTILGRRAWLGICKKSGPHHRWKPSHDALLGKQPDWKVARKIGCSLYAVRCRRIVRKIPRYLAQGRWTEAQKGLLGVMEDWKVAKQLNRSLFSVQNYRLKQGIPRYWPNPPWTAAEDALLGKVNDVRLARRLGRTRGAVYARRRKFKIAPLVPRSRPR